MHAKTLIAGSMLAVGFAAAQKDAQVTTDNPMGPVYIATLPETDSTTIRGSVTASAGTDGKGVVFAISFSGLADDGAPYGERYPSRNDNFKGVRPSMLTD